MSDPRLPAFFRQCELLPAPDPEGWRRSARELASRMGVRVSDADLAVHALLRLATGGGPEEEGSAERDTLATIWLALAPHNREAIAAQDVSAEDQLFHQRQTAILRAVGGLVHPARATLGRVGAGRAQPLELQAVTRHTQGPRVCLACVRALMADPHGPLASGLAAAGGEGSIEAQVEWNGGSMHLLLSPEGSSTRVVSAAPDFGTPVTLVLESTEGECRRLSFDPGSLIGTVIGTPLRRIAWLAVEARIA